MLLNHGDNVPKVKLKRYSTMFILNNSKKLIMTFNSISKTKASIFCKGNLSKKNTNIWMKYQGLHRQTQLTITIVISMANPEYVQKYLYDFKIFSPYSFQNTHMKLSFLYQGQNDQMGTVSSAVKFFMYFFKMP